MRVSVSRELTVIFLISVSEVPPLIQGAHPYPSAPGDNFHYGLLCVVKEDSMNSMTFWHMFSMGRAAYLVIYHTVLYTLIPDRGCYMAHNCHW